METKNHETTQRKSLAAAEEHITRYRASGMTQMAYCEEHGIKKATFAYWLKRQREAQRTESGGFVRVTPSGVDNALEIQFVNGVVVRFNTLVDARYIRELIG